MIRPKTCTNCLVQKRISDFAMLENGKRDDWCEPCRNPVVEMKKCATCEKEKRVDEFNWSNSKKLSRNSSCKACRAGYQKDYHRMRTHPEEFEPPALKAFVLAPTSTDLFLPHQHGLRWTGLAEVRP